MRWPKFFRAQKIVTPVIEAAIVEPEPVVAWAPIPTLPPKPKPELSPVVEVVEVVSVVEETPKATTPTAFDRRYDSVSPGTLRVDN